MSLDPNKLTPKQQVFLAAYIGSSGNLTHAAKIAEVSYVVHFMWLKESELYVAEFEKAKPLAKEHLRDSAIKRAEDGVQEPVFQGGELVGWKNKFSDTLMLALLKGAFPGEYKDRSEVGWDKDSPLTIDPGRDKLSDEALGLLRALAAKNKSTEEK